MEARSQFTFYESYAKAVARIKRAADRAQAYDAIVNYALYGTLPDLDSLPEAVAIVFELSKPNLDSSRKKAESGRTGGRGKQSESEDNGEANGKQTESKSEATGKQGEGASEKEKEKENKKEGEVEKEKEDECPPPTPSASAAEVEPRVTAASGAVADYLNRVNPSASQQSLQLLAAYERDMGADVCKRAIDIALDERKPSWSYIRAILQRWSAAKVKCLADIDALDTQHQAQKRSGGKYTPGAGATAPQPGVPGEADRRAREDMDRLRKIMAQDKP